jgi:hypothetical protein
MIRALAVLLALGIGLGFAGFALSTEKEMKKTPSLEDLGWMAGRWRLLDEGDVWEETWSPHEGDSMVGMMRWVKAGKVSLYELMALEQGEDGLVFRMLHFGRGLAAWESEKKGPLTYRATLTSKGRLEVEDPKRDFPRRIVYAREGDVLEVILTGEKDGKPRVASFRFTRTKD